MSAPTRRKLSPARRRLLDLMRELWFGRIQQFAVRNGEPILDPPPRVLYTKRFGKDATPGVTPNADCALKREVVDLLATLDEVQHGFVTELVVQHGLPTVMTVERIQPTGDAIGNTSPIGISNG